MQQASLGFWNRHATTILLMIASAGLLAGAGFWIAQDARYAHNAWTSATSVVLVSLVFQIFTALRRGDVGLDIIAALSMSAAIAFNEPLAGNVVAVMYSGGQHLEKFAEGRARREMSALMSRVARSAMRYNGNELEEVPISSIEPGQRLLIRQGEVLPVDGRVSRGTAMLDMSALTGESLPKHFKQGDEALSGAASTGPAFDLTATRGAADSTYAGIVRLVEAAQSSKPPMVRLADRFAVVFLLLTILIAGVAWYLSADPVRALSVLVVATPCPLILAVPVAIISGMSRAAKIGVLVKSGGMLEMLAQVRTVILDKTGTLTRGNAAVVEIRASAGFTKDEVLRAAASLDQASGHVIAEALITAAAEQNLALSIPEDVVESAGSGLSGSVDRRKVVIGGRGFVQTFCTSRDPDPLLAPDSGARMTVAVAIDDRLAGIIALEDPIRPDAMLVLRDFRAAGIRRIVLASGDRTDIANAVGAQLGLDAALGDLTPQDKVAVVRREAINGPVMMVGDGVNDAPALAAADLGVAMGARGTASSSEAAGIVLLVDELGPLTKALVIARRSRTIAFQSVVAGLALSLTAMIVAAFGYLQPVEGAILQEAIDVAVIVNALRALR